MREVLELSMPYLPYTGALGEMVLSSGQGRSTCTSKGVDGIIDISPFTCMNGIVTEAVYPVVQQRPRWHARSAPSTSTVRRATWSATSASSWSWRNTYRRRKNKVRRYPAYFGA